MRNNKDGHRRVLIKEFDHNSTVESAGSTSTLAQNQITLRNP